MSSLHMIQVKHLGHAEAMRKIRNECRLSMTHDQSEISVEQQRRWFSEFRQDPLNQAYLGCWPTVGDPVAYGVIRNLEGADWISGGVSALHRGQGFGYQIFELLTLLSSKPAYLDVLLDNERARALYRKLGWIEFGYKTTSFGTVALMRKE